MNGSSIPSSSSDGMGLLGRLTNNIPRQRNRKTSMGSFNDLEIASVWNKTLAIPGYDMQLWRQDACGAPIYRSNYGLTVETGWEIDHINPVSNGGNDFLSNLQALQWENNRFKADKLTNMYCVVPKRGS